MSDIYNIKDVNIDELKFSSVRSKTGRRYISVFYNKKPLVLVLPKLRVPFNSQISMYNALEFNMSLDDKEELKNNLMALDKKMVEYAKVNNWFNDDNFKYNPLVKESTGDYPPNMKFKITKKDGEIVTKFFDKDKKEVQVTSDKDVLELLKAGVKVISFVECSGVWFSEMNGVQNFGLYWKVTHLRVFPREAKNDKISDYIFEDSSDEDKTPEDYMFDD